MGFGSFFTLSSDALINILPSVSQFKGDDFEGFLLIVWILFGHIFIISPGKGTGKTHRKDNWPNRKSRGNRKNVIGTNFGSEREKQIGPIWGTKRIPKTLEADGSIVRQRTKRKIQSKIRGLGAHKSKFEPFCRMYLRRCGNKFLPIFRSNFGPS